MPPFFYPHLFQFEQQCLKSLSSFGPCLVVIGLKGIDGRFVGIVRLFQELQVAGGDDTWFGLLLVDEHVSDGVGSTHFEPTFECIVLARHELYERRESMLISHV